MSYTTLELMAKMIDMPGEICFGLYYKRRSYCVLEGFVHGVYYLS